VTGAFHKWFAVIYIYTSLFFHVFVSVRRQSKHESSERAVEGRKRSAEKTLSITWQGFPKREIVVRRTIDIPNAAAIKIHIAKELVFSSCSG
jgi:hypothetical protein